MRAPGYLSNRSAPSDAQRLDELAGHLRREELWGVDEALLTVLGLRGSATRRQLAGRVTIRMCPQTMHRTMVRMRADRSIKVT